MADSFERVLSALSIITRFRTPKKIETALREGHAVEAARRLWSTLDENVRTELTDEAQELVKRGVDVALLHDDLYPATLRGLPDAPPMLFWWGNAELFSQPGVGMCGSRKVSVEGLRAARACGLKVAENGLTVISGYAKGVDTATHLAALEAGGRTVIVLAEGINHWRIKRDFKGAGVTEHNVLVLSQFPPRQPWNAGAAMARNGVIAGMGKALVVIEAGETGGTLNAGKQGLEMGRPVVALEFSQATPAGNKLLHERGAHAIRTGGELGEWLQQLGEPAPAASADQLALRLG